MAARLERVDVVDGLRGIAIVAVVFHHLFARGLEDFGWIARWLLGNGWLGVDLFFILSGFVLHLPFARGHSLDFRTFYIRRARRLAPLFYIVALVSTVVIVALCGAAVDRHLLFQTIALFSGLFSFDPSTFMPQANWVLWSLGVEFIFSALFPIFVLHRARLPEITVAAILLCPIVRAVGYSLGERHYLDWISASAVGRLDEFLIGMLIAQFYVQRRLPSSPRPMVSCGVAVLLGAGLLFQLWAGGMFPQFAAAGFISLGAAGFGLILSGALASRGGLRAAFSWRPLRIIGVGCYSIYVWHGILLLGLFRTQNLNEIPVWSAMLIPYLAALASLSWASFRLIEGGFLPALFRRVGARLRSALDKGGGSCEHAAPDAVALEAPIACDRLKGTARGTTQGGMTEVATHWLSQLLDQEADTRGLTLASTRSGPVFVRKGDIIGDAVVAHGAWDYFLYPVIEQLAARRGVALDVGAQFGVITCVMAQYFDRVIAIEPNFDSFRILTLNSLIRPNITPINACAYDRHTVLSLSVATEQDIDIPLNSRGEPDFASTDNVGSFSFSEQGTGLNPIHTLRVDDLSISNLSLIKIDVQGADGRVIIGARETIVRNRPIVLFEWEEILSKNYGISLDKIINIFKDIGYSVDILFTHNEKQIDYIARPVEMESEFLSRA